MSACFPDIPKGLEQQKHGISFEIAQPTRSYASNVVMAASSEPSILPNATRTAFTTFKVKDGRHGKTVKNKGTITFAECTDGKMKEKPKSTGKERLISKNDDRELVDCFDATQLSKRSLPTTDFRTSEDDSKLKKLLREKDREITRLQEIIRKLSLDRESVQCTDAASRMRVAELKNRLSSQHRQVERVTTVERLRSKQMVSADTERLRHERDEARVQLARHEKHAWQLRKRVDQLGYVSEQRYKTIQELTKKCAMKEKGLQEMRKRMEQAQLISISCGSTSVERRMSDVTRNSTWDVAAGAGRLPKVNE